MICYVRGKKMFVLEAALFGFPLCKRGHDVALVKEDGRRRKKIDVYMHSPRFQARHTTFPPI